MATIIELTLEQIRDLSAERDKLGAMEEAKAPGMMIAQVFGDHMKVGVIDHEKACALQKAFGAEHEGKTVRTAYDVPANSNSASTEGVRCNDGLGRKVGDGDTANKEIAIEWQPIETAPKDGREVILAVETRAGLPHGVLVGHYMPGGHCIEDHPPIASGWYFWNGCMFDQAARPTHWMQMPNHPKWPADGWQAQRKPLTIEVTGACLQASG